MLFTAAKPEGELRITPPRLLPIVVAAGNFLDVLADPGFQAWLRVSLVVALASTAIVVLAATPAAYYTARHRFPGRSAFLVLVLVTQMFSPTALVVGLYRQFFELDLVNTYTALILTNAAFNLAFAIWILRAFFASIPREIEEAAAVDGCGRLRTLVRVILPLSLPGLVTAVIFAFIAAWNEYIVALTLMTDPDKRPLTVGDHLVRHRLRAALESPLRGLGHRHRARGRALRADRAPPRRRAHRGQREVTGAWSDGG